MGKENPTPKERRDEAIKLLKRLGVKPAVKISYENLDWGQHAHPIVMELWARGQAPADYPDRWREHAKTCSHCKFLFETYKIPLD